MNKLNFRLEYDELAKVLNDHIEQRLEKDWNIPSKILKKLHIKVIFMNNYDGQISHVEVEVKKEEAQ